MFGDFSDFFVSLLLSAHLKRISGPLYMGFKKELKKIVSKFIF